MSLNPGKIRIAHVIEGFEGGTCTYMMNVLPGLKKKGFNVTLICSLKRKTPDHETKISLLRLQGVDVRLVPMRRRVSLINDSYCFLLLVKYLFRHKFDIIHTHCSKAGVLARTAAFLVGTKAVFHSAHCFAFFRCGNKFTRGLYFYTEKLLARITTCFIAVSESERRFADKFKIFPFKKSCTINNGLPLSKPRVEADQDAVRRSLNLPRDRHIILSAVRMVSYKGISKLIEAAKYTKSDCVFLIAGEGELKRNIIRHINREKLNSKIKLAGFVEDINKLYSICDAVVLVSDFEAQPYFLLEAMRAKRAVIASNVPGNRELLRCNKGLPVNQDPKRIAHAIDMLLCETSYRKVMVRNAYEYFKGKHDLERQISKLIKVYTTEFEKKRVDFKG